MVILQSSHPGKPGDFRNYKDRPNISGPSAVGYMDEIPAKKDIQNMGF